MEQNKTGTHSICVCARAFISVSYRKDKYIYPSTNKFRIYYHACTQTHSHLCLLSQVRHTFVMPILNTGEGEQQTPAINT